MPEEKKEKKPYPCCPMCRTELVPTRRPEQAGSWMTRPDGTQVAVMRCGRCTVDFQIPFSEFPVDEEGEGGIFQ